VSASPVTDAAYSQPVRTFHTVADGLPVNRINGLALTSDGALWAATSFGLMRYHSGRWEPVGEGNPEGSLAVACVASAGDALWTGTSCGVSRLQGGEWRHWWWDEGAPTRGVHQVVVAPDGQVWVRTSLWVAPESTPDPHELWRFDRERWHVYARGDRPQLLAIAAGPAGVFGITPDRVLALGDEGAAPHPVTLPKRLAGAAYTCLACGPDGSLALGTDRGLLLVAPGGKRTVLTAREGLPVEHTTCLAFGPGDDLWVGDQYGLAHRHQGAWRYYPGTRWVPAAPHQVLVDEADTAWVATSQGLSELAFRPITLAAKAEYFGRRMRERHFRDGWYCPIILAHPMRPDGPWLHEVTDNDGLHTGMQLAAWCFNYALTQHPEHEELCHRSFGANLRLERLTGKPGFFARCALHRGTRAYPSSGEWHRSTVNDHWLWKGDTSSDEMDGHLFGYAVYYDLVAQGEVRDSVAGLVDRIVRGIIESDYYLVDVDGLPTRWAMWNPEYLSSPQGRAQKKLNALEMLGYCKVAYHVTGDDFFQQAYLDLLHRRGYLQAVTEVTVACRPGEGPQYDDQLAFLTYYHLCRYEADPTLQAALLASLEASWQAQRIEANPFYNFVYGACTGKPCDAGQALATLQEVPLDQRNFSVHNSHRADLRFLDTPRGRLPVPLSWRERPSGDWESDPFVLDDHGDGRFERYTHWWLLAYWLGRYHGLLSPS